MWTSRFFFLTKQREGPEKFSDRSGLRWSHSFIHSYLIPLAEKMNNTAVTWREYMNFAYTAEWNELLVYDPRSSERYLSRSAEKGLITVFEPWPLRWQCLNDAAAVLPRLNYQAKLELIVIGIRPINIVHPSSTGLSWNNITTSCQLAWQLKLMDCTGIRSLSS